MYDFGQLEGQDIILIRKAYAIVNALNGRDHEAGFGAALQAAEDTRAFSDITSRAAADGIKPGVYIAVHALAGCAEQLKEFPPSAHFDELSELLFGATEELLGPEIRDHVREWVDAAHAQAPELAATGPWAKLGAMTRCVKYLDIAEDHTGLRTPGNKLLLASAASDHRAIADACKGLGEALDAYFRMRASARPSILRSSRSRRPGQPGTALTKQPVSGIAKKAWRVLGAGAYQSRSL